MKESIDEKENEKNEENEELKFVKVNEKTNKIEKEMNKTDKDKKKCRKKLAIIIIIFATIILFTSTIFALVNINNDKIISGVTIKGIEVSGLSKDEAKTKLETIYNEKMSKEIEIKYQDFVSNLNPTIMEVKYDIEKAVNEAYLIGKSNNIFFNNYQILFTLIKKKDINVEMSLNEEITKQNIEDIGLKIPGIVIESTYSIEDDKLIISKGKEGKHVDTENLLLKVKEILNEININKNYIEMPVIDKKPEEINLDKIHEEVYKEVKDAYYTKEPFTIYPEVIGVDFNVEEAKKMIQSEEKEEYEIPLIITKPKVTIDQIGTEAFPDLLGTFTTRYDGSARDRTTNLVLACQKINGKVLLAGDIFSYNQTLGARTAAAGYKNAKVYENGQVVDGIGGGICQISSTLYNAALFANLEIVERRNHQFVTSYAPAGRDATVVYGMTDFRFKNTRKYPIRIVASATNGIAKVSIYGIKEENEYTFQFNTKTVATIPFTTIYEEDSSLEPGTEKVKQNGANGIRTETYITKMLDGKIVSSKLLSRDTYDAMNKIVLRGKAPEENQNPVENNNNQEQIPKEPETPKQIENKEPEPKTQEVTEESVNQVTENSEKTE